MAPSAPVRHPEQGGSRLHTTSTDAFLKHSGRGRPSAQSRSGLTGARRQVRQGAPGRHSRPDPAPSNRGVCAHSRHLAANHPDTRCTCAEGTRLFPHWRLHSTLVFVFQNTGMKFLKLLEKQFGFRSFHRSKSHKVF